MFATLDPTVRHLTLPSHRKVLASDTVGFIRNLPTTLVKAFRATLEEVTEAALLLHVVDASSPSAPQHTAHVFEVLAEIGADQTRQILVLNKMDHRLDCIDAAAGDTENLAQRILGEVKSQRAHRSHPRVGAHRRWISANCSRPSTTLCRWTRCRASGSAFRRAKARSFTYSTSAPKCSPASIAATFCEVEAEVPESVKRRLSRYLAE